MRRQILLDENGYLLGMSNCPFTICGRASFEAEVPEEIAPELAGCYRMDNGRLVLDERRRTRLIGEDAERARREALRERADVLIREKMAGIIARDARADDVIVLSAYLPEWSPGAYLPGDIVAYRAAPYRCVKAHDSGGHPLWTPARAKGCWRGYHARERELALPYERPWDEKYAYRAGEWMRWTDGKAYICLKDGTIDGPDADGGEWAVG